MTITDNPRLNLGEAAARTPATTTKSVPQMQGISSRWLLRTLPWVQVSGGAYRVNRRLSHAVGDGRIVQRELSAGDRADQVFLIAHGKIDKIGVSAYGDETILGAFSPGGAQASNDHGEARIDVASGHDGEPLLPGTFVDYETKPREYELSVAQTVLRVHTRTGPPTPDDLDELLALAWKDPGFFHAHPRAIAVLMRTGEDTQGVVGLHQVGLPDEYRPGPNVRFMRISEQAIISYLVSAYYSAAVPVPDALAILENAELGREG